MHNVWKFREAKPEKSKEMQTLYSVHPIAADVLAARGWNAENLENYFALEPLEDPFTLTDMDRAVDRINQAIDQGERIAVYGDYDCDGITSCYIVFNYLISMGVEVIPYIPEREQGYGITKQGLDFLKEKGVTLVITVDSGITAIEEARYCQALGMDLIVTDHHTVGEKLPQAVAVVNPKREKEEKGCFKDLSGAGVAFKLIAAMQDGDYDAAFDFAGEFAAIGTISDIMPLVGENRTLVRRGLSSLRYTDNIGLRALFSTAGISLNAVRAGQIGFRIAPFINAAGRIAKAQDAFRLLLTEDEEEAVQIAEYLQNLVVQRREMEEEIYQDILRTMERKARAQDRVLVFWGEYPAGLIGIVCSRLLKQFGKPAVVFSVEGEKAHGSARSLSGFSIYEAVKANQRLCENWGGHELAAGMTIPLSAVEAFKEGMNEYAKEKSAIMPMPTKQIDRVLSPSEITLDLAKELEKFEPFGNQNPAPIFLIKKAKLEEVRPLSNGAHGKLFFSAQGQRFSTVLFQMNHHPFLFAPGAELDLIGQVKMNRYKGKETVEFQMLDYWPSGSDQKEYFSQLAWFDSVIRGETDLFSYAEELLPERKDFASVYRFLSGMGKKEGCAQALYEAFFLDKMPYGKWRVILEVFRQEGLISVRPDGMKLAVLPVTQKVDLAGCELLQRLQTGR